MYDKSTSLRIGARNFLNGDAKNTAVITKAFVDMPEWIQVLTRKHGAHIITASDLPAKERGSGAAWCDCHIPGLLSLSVDPKFPEANLGGLSLDQGIRAVIREELLHGLQAHSHRKVAVEANANNAPASIAVKWQDRMQSAAVGFGLKNRVDSDSAAWKLIKRSEPNGGSLKDHLNFSDLGYLDELLIDVYDAEIALRNEKKDKVEVERELRAAFGDEVYDISREHVYSWIREAGKEMEKHLVDEHVEARLAKSISADFEQKWQADPFMHDRTLFKLPQYQLTAGLSEGRH